MCRSQNPENRSDEGNISNPASDATAAPAKVSFHKSMGFTDTIFSGFFYIAEGWEFYKGNKVQLKNEILSGLTVAIAQVPESVAFR